MRIYTIFLALAVLASCSANEPTKRTVHDAVHDVDFSIEHTSGPALSQAEDRVYAVSSGKRELVFEGYGASKISLLPLREGALLIEYCGGFVNKVDSYLANRTGDGNALAVRVQPIVIANVSIDGKRLCAE